MARVQSSSAAMVPDTGSARPAARLPRSLAQPSVAVKSACSLSDWSPLSHVTVTVSVSPASTSSVTVRAAPLSGLIDASAGVALQRALAGITSNSSDTTARPELPAAADAGSKPVTSTGASSAVESRGSTSR